MNEIVSQAIEVYDLVIAIGYQDIDPCWLDEKPQLAFLSHREDEQGGKFFLVPSKQKLEPKNLKLIKKIKKIANEQIQEGIRVDLLKCFSVNERSRAVLNYLNLQRRYFQALSVVIRFYGEEDLIKLHKFFLLEIAEETEDENKWIDRLIARYNSIENPHPKFLSFITESTVN